MGKVRLFGDRDLQSALDARLREVRAEVDGEADDQILNVNQTAYIGYLVDKYRIEPLVLDWDGLHVTEEVAVIPIEEFPDGGFMVGGMPGQRLEKQVVAYHLPFAGSPHLLRCQPSNSILWSMPADLTNGELTFTIPNFHDRPEDVKQEADQALNKIRAQAEAASRNVEEFNASIESVIRGLVSNRRATILKRRNMLESLGVPVERQPAAPALRVPVERKVIAVKPRAPTQKFTPEPAIALEDYRGILEVVHGLGLEMERHPSIYDGKDEEALRDLFIMQLSPHFASVTGETFNRAGKTDLLIRHESSNVFVGECKFWTGKKGYLATIDQILSYLTWRDSKAAIVCFVRNKDFTGVIERIEEVTPAHGCFVKLHEQPRPGWFQYEFHLAGDPSRPMHLAVLCFHLPAAESVGAGDGTDGEAAQPNG